MSQNNRALIFVIFGATGDLAHRKLLPAFFSIITDRLAAASMVKKGDPNVRVLIGMFEAPACTRQTYVKYSYLYHTDMTYNISICAFDYNLSKKCEKRLTK